VSSCGPLLGFLVWRGRACVVKRGNGMAWSGTDQEREREQARTAPPHPRQRTRGQREKAAVGAFRCERRRGRATGSGLDTWLCCGRALFRDPTHESATCVHARPGLTLVFARPLVWRRVGWQHGYVRTYAVWQRRGWVMLTCVDALRHPGESTLQPPVQQQ
jgi:hypothetical protein